jgi:predicted RNA-binding protein YlqC (UPF0109 family)
MGTVLGRYGKITLALRSVPFAKGTYKEILFLFT